MTSQLELLRFWKSMHVDDRLLKAFLKVPREYFIPRQLRGHAYDDHPLPTFRNQSVSQPSTIIIMLQALDLRPKEKVFELGAGAGYQAAIIGHAVGPKGKVVSMDILPELVHFARRNIADLRLRNVQILEGDGAEGHMEHAPFDKIIVTAACPEIPPPLIDQLKDGGIIVAPIGDQQSQTMVKATKLNGKLELEFLGDFLFVPLMGKYGFEERRCEH